MYSLCRIQIFFSLLFLSKNAEEREKEQDYFCLKTNNNPYNSHYCLHVSVTYLIFFLISSKSWQKSVSNFRLKMHLCKFQTKQMHLDDKKILEWKRKIIYSINLNEAIKCNTVLYYQSFLSLHLRISNRNSLEWHRITNQ